MSEKIYAFLLRLYPAHFRETYGEPALQLVRDRLRDESGFFAKLKLWLDLLVDLVVSVPQMRHSADSWMIGTSGHLNGLPLFHLLKEEPLHLGRFLLGSALSSIALSGCFLSIKYAQYNPPLIASQLQSPMHQSAGTATSMPETVTLDAAERHRLIQAVVEKLKSHYVDPGATAAIANTLSEHEEKGTYNLVTDKAAFAALLTAQMRDVSHDSHLDVVYSRALLPRQLPIASGGMAGYREAMAQANCTFEKVEIRSNNIGYLKLNSFPDLSICQTAMLSSMSSLNNVDALIFDLRDNMGGYPSMVSQIAAYFFDHPEYLYNPRENTTKQSWTHSPVPGNKLADKPVFVLTSKKTISGAEQFCYNMKALKRATLVGETTRGSAHAGTFHRIDDHFGIGIPEARSINPFGETDWEGKGVEPDVKVKASDSLEIAESLLRTRLRGK